MNLGGFTQSDRKQVVVGLKVEKKKKKEIKLEISNDWYGSSKIKPNMIDLDKRIDWIWNDF